METFQNSRDRRAVDLGAPLVGDSTRRARLAVALLFPSPALAMREVPVRIEPAQLVHAVRLTDGNGADCITLDIRAGCIIAPPDFPLPWTVTLDGFESLIYTAADLAAERPLLMRQLGTLRGKLVRPAPHRRETFTWFLRQRGGSSITEIRVEVSDDGTFEIPVPAGLYEGSALGERSISKLRSGIVVKPGEVTDLGSIQCDATGGAMSG